MTDKSRAEISNLLGTTSEEQFSDSCAWSDDLLSERPETAAWSHVFIPKTARNVDIARDCARGCVVDAIEREATIISSSAPKPQRAEALKFLAHLVADLHQPLNVAFAEDRGGRDIKVSFLGRSTTMYELWNSHLLAAPNPPSYGYTPFLQELTDRYDRERWTIGTPRDWAEETLWIMRAPPTGYVGNPGELAFDETYVRQNYLIAVDQIGKSGVRLAFLLNAMFQ